MPPGPTVSPQDMAKALAGVSQSALALVHRANKPAFISCVAFIVVSPFTRLWVVCWLFFLFRAVLYLRGVTFEGTVFSRNEHEGREMKDEKRKMSQGMNTEK
jgi:hypothetical protein